MWNDVESGDGYMVLNRSLLHMIYYSTLSALHRPQVLPSSGMAPKDAKADVIDVSRKAVRLAANEITSIANTLYNLDLVRLLPTTGITVLLPAVIIHLLDIKAPDETTRRTSLQGFCQCMQTMVRLRDIYAAADYSTAFLEAAIRKAEITLPQKSNEVKEPRNVITSTQGLMDAGRRMKLTNPPPHAHISSARAGHLTPPPEDRVSTSSAAIPSGITPNGIPLTDDDIARRLSTFLASTPPDSEGHHHHTSSGASEHNFNSSSEGGSNGESDHHHHNNNFMQQPWNDSASEDVKFSLHDDEEGASKFPSTNSHSNPFFADGAILVSNTISNATLSNAGNPASTLADFEPDFDSMINLDALGGFDESGFGGGMLQGESGGFTLDMDWMQAGVGGGIGGGVGEDDGEDGGVLGGLGAGQSALDGISRMAGGM
jgi:hypothetical protein